MHPELIRAQTQTMTEWAEQWDRETASGSSEVGFLLRRAAKLAMATVGVKVEDHRPSDSEPGDHVPHMEDTELRHG